MEPKHLVGHIREALATDPRTNVLDVTIKVAGRKAFIMGEVASHARKQAASEVVSEVLPPDMELVDELWIAEVQRTGRTGDPELVRIAAVGDVHIGLDMSGELRPTLSALAQDADVLLLAGDLTQHGSRDEGRLLAEEVADAGIPTVAVLGNHDYHLDAQDAIRTDLERVGVTVLEGESVVLELAGRRIGIAGVKGFGGGFAGACGSEFGEPEMKSFMRHSKSRARQLLHALKAMQCDIRVALTHYAPTKDTLLGEKLEIYPFLGSHLLGEAIDEAGCDLAVHGHAHHGSERGITPGGVPVRNVAKPLIHAPYQLYALRERSDEVLPQRGVPLDLK